VGEVLGEGEGNEGEGIIVAYRIQCFGYNCKGGGDTKKLTLGNIITLLNWHRVDKVAQMNEKQKLRVRIVTSGKLSSL
jgi:hypothetical protein